MIRHIDHEREARFNRKPSWRRRLVIALPLLWMTAFFLLPFLFVIKISLAEAVIARPPYTALISFADGRPKIALSFASYAYIFSDPLYWEAIIKSLRLAAATTVSTLLLGYPIAYVVARARGHRQLLLLALVTVPFWSSFLLRVYAWKLLLQTSGPLNALLLAIGIVDRPLAILHSDWAVLLGMVYSYLPFMILPLYAQLERLDPALLEAATDLGASAWRTFRRIIWPLSLPGVAAGAALVFIPAVGEFVVPELLGGPETAMIGRLIWTEFFANRDWPMASALAVIMLLLLILPFVLFERRVVTAQAEGTE